MDDLVGRSLARRKREGAVYTPAPIARFLASQTIARALDERRQSLAAQHGGERTESFWRAWLEALKRLAILDPACGDGALLDAAFDAMAARYEEALRRLTAFGAPVAPDRIGWIVDNLFGVDIDAQAAKAARRRLHERCFAVEPAAGPPPRGSERDAIARRIAANLRVGDSLVDDPAASAKAFDWRAAFPDALARGGFDIVIGNPPYVRMEYLKPLKPWLARRYEVAAERADLYAYFFEKGVALLKDGGRLGYISSSTFFRTGAGEKLRAFLARSGAIECVVDFGDLSVFDGVVAYPAIIALRKGAPRAGDLAFLRLGARLPDDLCAAFRDGARPMARARLGAGFWRFEEEALARLRDKIAEGRRTLRDIHGPPLWGVKTGLNDGFVIDGATRERLIADDPASADVLKPYLRGAHIGRWRIAAERLWLVDLPKGGDLDIARFPAIEARLARFRQRLEARATRQNWFELQQPQLAYRAAFAAPKIVFPDISQGPKFALDASGTLIDATAFALPCADLSLLALLNSRLCWFFLHSVSNPLRGGKWRLRLKAQYVGLAPIPDLPPEARARLAAAAGANGEAARRRASANAAESARLATEIEAREREIDEIVYGLFGLSATERAMVETSLAGQY